MKTIKKIWMDMGYGVWILIEYLGWPCFRPIAPYVFGWMVGRKGKRIYKDGK